MNTYGYAGVNPVNYFDPYGLDYIDTVGGFTSWLINDANQQLACEGGAAGEFWDFFASDIIDTIYQASSGNYSDAIQYATLVAVKPLKLTQRLRHFTNNKGLSGIRNDNIIRAYDQNSVFTVKARGRAKSPRDVESALGIGPGRGRNYIDFDANPNEFKKVKNPVTGATEYVFSSDVDLTGRNAKFFKR